MRVGVRYCGGCNPRYDRVAALERLRRRHPEATFFTAAPGVPMDLLLVVCGCSACCASVSDLDLPPERVFRAACEEDLVRFSKLL